MNAIIERARALAIAAGIDPAVVEGDPVEWTCMHDATCLVWGLHWSEVSALETNGEAWFETYPEVRLGPDVFTWEGLERYSIWVDEVTEGTPEGYVAM
jgi:hypothetical protein